MNFHYGNRVPLRAFWTMLCILLLLTGGVMAALAVTVTFTSDTTIDTTNTTYEGYDVIVNGCTVTINGAHSFHSLTVNANGVVTHAPALTAGMNLTVAGDVIVNAGGAIQADGRGYPSDQGPGAGGTDFTSNGGGGGASYGGEGRASSTAQAGKAYGDIKAPNFLGSGGGSGYAFTYAGGAGGGFITLTVGGRLQVNGALTVNGGSSVYGGGGSGGTLYLTANALAGNGTISANGGVGYPRSDNYTHIGGGGGGGGRIALFYTTNYASSTLAARGLYDYYYGGNYEYAGAGTVFMQQAGQAQGDLLVDNQGGYNNDGANFVTGTPILTPQTFDNARVRNYGVIVPPPSGKLTFTVLNTCTVEYNGFIAANGRGYAGSTGPGAGKDDGAGGGGGGGSYGGEARSSNTVGGGSPYGDLRMPTDMGSGGGSGLHNSVPGSPGGGAIFLTINGTLRLDGVISANGVGTDYAGGGAGGGILLDVGALSGNGTIAADGNANRYAGVGAGSGSGGRIAIYYDSKTYTGTMRAAGGYCNYYGYAGAGTIFQQQTAQTQGMLWIHNNGNSGLATPLADEQTFDSVLVENYGILAPLPMTTLKITTLGDFVIGRTGYVSADGRGYGPSSGPGKGTNDRNGWYGVGAGYGGNGGVSPSNSNFLGGTTYGSELLPTDYGSGGGAGIYGNYPGSAGGGAIYLVANGTLQIDGYITAYGNASSNYGGGGSGGSVLLRVGHVAGQGTIYANGGYAYYGGGGGGGRIALYYVVSAFTGTITALGGGSNYGGPYYGANGTTHQEQIPGNLVPTLSINPTTVGGGRATYGTVLLSDVAPAGGIDINLTSSDPSIVVPPMVTVEEGTNSAMFTITTPPVSAVRTAKVSAQLWDQVSSQVVTVKPNLSTIKFNPGSVGSNTSVTGTLTLGVPAPAGGLIVGLTSSNSSVTVPATVLFPGGTTTKTFTATVGAVSQAGSATITASYSIETVNGTVFVSPGASQVSAVAISPASVIGGGSATGVVTLAKAAPAGGAIVALSSSDSTVTVPASVTVPAGKTSASFAISTTTVQAPKSVIVSATLGVTKMATLSVRLPGVASLALLPSTLSGGDTSIGIVTLEQAATVPITVTITSSSRSAVPDAIVVIPTGSTQGTFTIATSSVSATVTATITAGANGLTKSQKLTITP